MAATSVYIFKIKSVHVQGRFVRERVDGSPLRASRT